MRVRKLLLALTCLLALVPILEAQVRINLPVRTRPADVGGGGDLITEADIDWECEDGCGLGVLPYTLSDSAIVHSIFAPGDYGGWRNNEGFAYWDDNGTPRFVSTANALTGDSGSATNIAGEPFDFTCVGMNPDTTTNCTVGSLYGNAYDNIRVDINDSPANVRVFGPTSLMVVGSAAWFTYWADPYGNAGSGSAANNPSLCNFTLVAGNGVGNACYSFEDVGFKLRAGFTTAIPAAFQGDFGSKTHFLCNNGYGSGGGQAIDLQCYAITLPNGAHLSEVASSAFKQVIGHTYSQCSNSSTRTNRPAWVGALLFNYYDIPAACTPGSAAYGNDGQESFNVRSFGDVTSHCAFVHNTSSGKHGLVCFDNWATGGNDYIAASIGAHGMKTGISVYDPSELAAVYAGSQATNYPTIKQSWEHQFPIFNYSDLPFSNATKTVTTAAAVAATNRFRFTFSAAHGFSAGSQFSVFGNTALDWPNGFADGFTVATNGVISATVVDACVGQESGYCTVDDTEMGDPNPDITMDYSENSLSALTYLSAPNYGHPVGVAWMPSNSACGGEDNMIAVAFDACAASCSTPSNWRRYIKCGKVN